ncbi:MAG: hypothetical protein JO368_10635 [Acidimicrobiales bacterium]|nr:hypothetical protein [Acidimicrobiales bacterium]
MRPPTIERLLQLIHFDLAPRHRQPSSVRVAAATLVAISGSLVADAGLVAAATRLFPATKGYHHFAFGDYAPLTVLGVLIAAAGWPIVTRVSSAPRWLYLRAAIVTTVVLFLPDLWLLLKGDEVTAVLVLMAMHVAIAVITYNALVRLAPVGARTGLRAVPDPPV